MRVLFLSSAAFRALLSVAALAAGSSAQDEQHVVFTARAVPAQVAPGATLTVEVSLQVAPGLHIYGGKDGSMPTRLEFTSTAGLVAKGPPRIPDGTPHTAAGITNHWLEGSATLQQDFEVPQGLAAGNLKLQGRLSYMACTEEFCNPPRRDPFEVTVQVTGASGATGATGAVATGSGSGAADPLPGALELHLEPPKIRLRPEFSPAVARPGELVVLRVEVTVDPGWHVYGQSDPTYPTRLRLHEVGPLEVRGFATVPAGDLHDVGVEAYWLAGTFAIEQRFVVPADAASGAIEVRGDIDHMPCSDSSCLEPAQVAFARSLGVEAGPVRPAYAAADAPPRVEGPVAGTVQPTPVEPTRVEPGPDPLPAGERPVLRQPRYTLDDVGTEDGLRGSLWALILLSIAGGLFALVMPCTYPMIPITFSFFTKQAETRHGKVLSLALIYGGGIVLMFASIGLAVDLIGSAIGGGVISFAAHWTTNLVIGVAFVVFALSLFGFFTLQLPAFVTNAAGRAGRTGGLIGVFLMGATLVVTSFTCTAPIVGALLAGIADGGRATFGMAVFGLTMAAPFVLLALLPGRVKALPRSGEWMNTLKVSLGFIELAAALKFLSNVDLALGWHVLPRETYLMIWAFLFVVLALYLFGLFGYRGAPATGVSGTRNGFGLASLAFAFYCLFGTMGFQLDAIMTAFEPPYRLRPIEEHTVVKDDHQAAVALARREGKYLLVNFTGFTCNNCRLVEGVTFRDPQVAQALENRFVESRLHMDGEDVVQPTLFAQHRRLQSELIGTRAMPYYAILDPVTGEFLFRSHLRGGDPEGWKKDFLAMFDKLPERPRRRA